MELTEVEIVPVYSNVHFRVKSHDGRPFLLAFSAVDLRSLLDGRVQLVSNKKDPSAEASIERANDELCMSITPAKGGTLEVPIKTEEIKKALEELIAFT